MRIVIPVSLLCFLLGYLVGIYSVEIPECPSLSCPGCPECPDCVCPACPECPELPLLLQEAQTVAKAHDYDIDRYNCRHFTEELIKRLRADGYKAKYCIGVYKPCTESKPEEYCYHAWVKTTVYIEATTGEVIEPKDYKRLRKVSCGETFCNSEIFEVDVWSDQTFEANVW